jgi:hypothetical protein
MLGADHQWKGTAGYYRDRRGNPRATSRERSQDPRYCMSFLNLSFPPPLPLCHRTPPLGYQPDRSKKVDNCTSTNVQDDLIWRINPLLQNVVYTVNDLIPGIIGLVKSLVGREGKGYGKKGLLSSLLGLL